MQQEERTSHNYQVGLPPGSLVKKPGVQYHDTVVHAFDFDLAGIREYKETDPGQCREFLRKESVSWVDVVGLKDFDVISQIGEIFSIHPLALEAVLNMGQRPKVEEYENQLFIVLKMLRYVESDHKIVDEQISLVLGPGYVVTFQEMEGDVFAPIRDRIRVGTGRVRKSGSDYLAYTLLDVIVDNYFFVIDRLNEKIEVLEDEIFTNTAPEILDEINEIRKESLSLRRHARPMRELFARLDNIDSPLIKQKTMPFLRDVYDHASTIADLADSFRDNISAMVEHHRSSLSTRLNEVMKLLTIIGTIFIPLTFIAGIYGMNFEVMPELKWRYGYPTMLMLMVVITVCLLFYFRRKKWL